MKKIVLFVLTVLSLLVLSSCSSTDYSSTQMNYFKQDFKYHNLVITVNAVDENIQGDGSFLTTVSFSAKNTGKSTYHFYLSDIYLKNTETDSKYDCQTSLMEEIFRKGIASGETEDYDVEFTIPTSVSSSQYIIYFDFGSLGSPEGKCALYYENGDMVEVSNRKQEYINEIKSMQTDIYNIMKQSIYDKIDGNMSYSYIQSGMDKAERQIKTKIPTFFIYLDLTGGTISPKWICFVKTNDGNTYPLMYISVDLNSSYYASRKYIGKYNID